MNPADYIAFVKTRRCLVCDAHPVHAHHAGYRGLGQKASDWTCIPLCAERCHEAWHNCTGPFADRDERRRWTEEKMLEMNRLYGRHVAGRSMW